MSYASAPKNVAVLASLQALLIANGSTTIALNGLVGQALASDKALATLPVTSWVVGGALTTLFASLLMKRIGRRRGFTVGAAVGLLGAATCCTALVVGSFWLFVLGTLVFGVYNAFGQYYRFAAADAAPEAWRARAISYVLAGGLVGGVAGPTISSFTKDLLPMAFLGAYLALIGLLLIAMSLVQLLEIPPARELAQAGDSRPLREIARQPLFLVAVTGGALGYGVMNLLMTATPLAMGACGHSYGATATVIASHVVGMFAPSFVTGDLIKRFGALQVMLWGVLINLVCIAIAVAGVTVANFWWSLVLLGIGWNFLFVSATSLLTETYRPAESAKVQGINDLVIFLTMVASSLSSGIILENDGWRTLNLAAIPLVGIIGLAVLWLIARRRRPTPAAGRRSSAWRSFKV